LPAGLFAEGESITNQIKVYAEYMQRSGLSGYSTPPPVPGTSGASRFNPNTVEVGPWHPSTRNASWGPRARPTKESPVDQLVDLIARLLLERDLAVNEYERRDDEAEQSDDAE